MSLDIQVIFDPARMPRPLIWASTARKLGFDVVLDSDFDPERFSGFLPCRYQNVDAGFEYFHILLDTHPGHFQTRHDASWTCLVAFGTRSPGHELATAIICSAVLCVLTGGVLIDIDGKTAIYASEVLKWAKSREAEIIEALPRQARVHHQSHFKAGNKTADKKLWWKLW